MVHFLWKSPLPISGRIKISQREDKSHAVRRARQQCQLAVQNCCRIKGSQSEDTNNVGHQAVQQGH